MKKLLLLLLLITQSAFATSLTGTVNDPAGNGVTGRISFRLAQQGAVYNTGACPGPFVVVPTTEIVFTLTSGVIQMGASVVGNDCIQPAKTYYIITVRDSRSNVLFTDRWSITGTTVDIGTIVTTSTAGTAFSGAVLLDPPFNADQSIASNVLPSLTKTYNFGAELNKWDTVWATRVQTELEYRIGDPFSMGGLEAVSVSGPGTTALNIGDPYTGMGRWTAINFYPGTSTAQLAMDNVGLWFHPAASTPTCVSGAALIYFDGTKYQVCEGTTGPTPLVDLGSVGVHLLPTTSNTFDIGGGTTVWRNGYFGVNVLAENGYFMKNVTLSPNGLGAITWAGQTVRIGDATTSGTPWDRIEFFPGTATYAASIDNNNIFEVKGRFSTPSSTVIAPSTGITTDVYTDPNGDGMGLPAGALVTNDWDNNLLKPLYITGNKVHLFAGDAIAGAVKILSVDKDTDTDGAIGHVVPGSGGNIDLGSGAVPFDHAWFSSDVIAGAYFIKASGVQYGVATKGGASLQIGDATPLLWGQIDFYPGTAQPAFSVTRSSDGSWRGPQFQTGSVIGSGGVNLTISNLDISVTGNAPYACVEALAPDGTKVCLLGWKIP